jgi:hypothetical protein
LSVTVTPLPNQAPTLNLVSVTGSYTAPGSLAMTVNPIDTDGTISRVEYRLDNLGVGTNTGIPFAFTFAGLSAGTHNLAAQAYDNAGGSSPVLSVNVTITNTLTTGGGHLTFFTANGLLDNPVYDADVTTKLDGRFKGQLYAGPTQAELLPAGQPENFLTGGGSGFIISGLVVCSNVNAGAAGFYELRAWEGVHATYEAAVAAGAKTGRSEIVAVVFGGGNPPVVGPDANKHRSFSLNAATPSVPLAIVTQPSSRIVLVGSNVVFGVTASGTGPLAYQWRKNGTNLTGPTSATLVLPNVNMEQSGIYTVFISNVSSNLSSAPATLTVGSSFFQPPAAQSSAAIQTQGFGLNLMLEAGRSFRVQTSSNLLSPIWIDVTNFVSTGAAIQFIDAAATNQTRRFYRIVSQ